MNQKELLINILNFNNYEKTIRCIQSIIKLNILNEKINILVVDNNSSNSSFKILKARYDDNPYIDVICASKNGGYSYGNNYGIRYAFKKSKYDFISIVNPDVLFIDDCFERILTFLYKNKEVSIASSMVIKDNHFDIYLQSWRIPTARELALKRSLLSKTTTAPLDYRVLKGNFLETEVIPGSFFIIRSKDFFDYGLFDENMFMYNEEIVLGIKIKKHEKKAAIDLGSYYIHDHKEPTNKQAWLNYRYNFSKVLKDYSISYTTRKYVCRHYYNSKGIITLNLINIANYLMLYIKHLVSLAKVKRRNE